MNLKEAHNRINQEIDDVLNSIRLQGYAMPELVQNLKNELKNDKIKDQKS